MTLFDAFFRGTPDYDSDNDPLAKPDEREAKDLPLHVRQCARRFSDLKKGHVEIAQQLQSTQKLLMIIILVLVSSKIIDLSVITGLVSP